MLLISMFRLSFSRYLLLDSLLSIGFPGPVGLGEPEGKRRVEVASVTIVLDLRVLVGLDRELSNGFFASHSVHGR